ncbi:MAG: MMPL family transporter, partial [Cyanobacteria bacterium REEB65]|nr:MMPL family transporter [Cyanobacteria bacterium REEB65]
TVAAWATLVLVTALFARFGGGTLTHGIAAVPGTDSQQVEQILEQNFDHPFIPTGFVTVHVRRGVPAGELDAALADLERTLRACRFLKGVRTTLDGPEIPVSRDGRTTFALVGLKAANISQSERLVAPIRAALAPLRLRYPGVELLYVSEAAINADTERAASIDCARAERVALPLALIVMILAFGTIVASVVPLLVGATATSLAVATLYLIGKAMPLSAFALSVTTMMGLGVGIDYALFILLRFREERQRGRVVHSAIQTIVPKAGGAVLTSGLTVLIGLTAMWAVGIKEPESVGLGGVIVVAYSVLAALTLTPALLTLLGDRLEALPVRPRLGLPIAPFWRALGLWVTQRPIRCLVIAVVLLAPLLASVGRIRDGFPPPKFFPQGLESSRGSVRLDQLGQTGGLAPALVVVKFKDGKATSPRALAELYEISRRIRSVAGIQQVASLVDLRPSLTLADYQALYLDPLVFIQQPLLARLFLSKDRSETLLQVVPANAMSFDRRMAMARQLRRLLGNLRLPGTTILVGGPPAMGADVLNRYETRFGWIIAGVVLVTYGVLLVGFNSYLLPLTAIVLNAVSVLAGYGALVLVFQEGHLARFLGLAGAMGSIPSMVPLMLFCLMFGLSMDYEVFMLSRIAEAYDSHGDPREAAAYGVAATARVITSAAAIMLVVFGSFAFAQTVMIKIFGFGLAVAVLVDATLVRMLLVPAVV